MEIKNVPRQKKVAILGNLLGELVANVYRLSTENERTKYGLLDRRLLTIKSLTTALVGYAEEYVMERKEAEANEGKPND